jgi:predicted ATPase/transcriptional regulator with XRE-family HTH domain
MMEEYSFGAWIRRRRKALDLTQQELARRISCSLSTIVKIESDQRRPSRQIAALLAERLSIPENQRELFLKVARGLKPVDQMSLLPIHLEPLLQSSAGKATCILPVPPTPLVGRKHELAEVMRLLTLPECSLLTIAGPGGVGKTRLALQVALELKATSPSSFPDGLCFVSLASVMVIEYIPKAIAGAIGFDLSGPLSPEDQLLNYLQKRSLLLLLDNVEHLLEGAKIFSKILERAPGVKLLVTSRERLNLRCEWVFDLHGLPVPPIDTDEGLEEYSAAKLFLCRIQQALTNFLLKEEDRPVVAQICRMLDGIPLGIELAAAWVRTLPLSEIAAEIAHDLDFLTTSARDIPERHRSLRIVFDHSWILLSSAEQRAMRQLSTFQGGFTREAAQEVAETLLPILNSLIDKSLLRRSEQARYDLQELVRGYAAAHLADEPEEEASTQERHSRYFLSMICDVGLDLQSDRQKEALTRLSSEIANIRSAWAWALAHDQIELLRKAAWSLWYFFDLRNYYREGEAVFSDAAEMVRRTLKDQQAKIGEADREMYTGALGQFLMHQAYFSMRMGKVDEAEALCQASISSLRSADNPEALAHALTYYAVLNWTIGKLDQAWSLLQESLPLSREHGPPWQIALFTGMLGIVAYERGEYGYSYQLLSEALERSQVVGDPRLTGFVSAYLGRTALKLKRTAEIEEILWEGAQITQESGDRFGYGLMLEQLALASWARGDFTSAEQLFDSSVELFREIGDVWYLSRALTSWGDFRQSVGELTQAAEHFRQAITLSLDAQAFLIAMNALVGMAGVHAQEDKAESALEIAIRVIEHPASPQDARVRANQIYGDLESQFTSDEIEAFHQRVRSETLEEFAKFHL